MLSVAFRSLSKQRLLGITALVRLLFLSVRLIVFLFLGHPMFQFPVPVPQELEAALLRSLAVHLHQSMPVPVLVPMFLVLPALPRSMPNSRSQALRAERLHTNPRVELSHSLTLSMRAITALLASREGTAHIWVLSPTPTCALSSHPAFREDPASRQDPTDSRLLAPPRNSGPTHYVYRASKAEPTPSALVSHLCEWKPPVWMGSYPFMTQLGGAHTSTHPTTTTVDG